MNDNFYGRDNNNEEQIVEINSNEYSDNNTESERQSYYYTQSSYNGPSSSGNYNNKPKKSKLGSLIGKSAVAALVFGLIVSAIFVVTVKVTDTGDKLTNTVVSYTADKISSNVSDLQGASDVSDIVDAAMPTVVAITGNMEVQVQSFFFGTRTETQPVAGSGVIIGKDDENLYIVTNNHVVADTVELSVTFVDNETIKAEVRGTNPGTDLAVVVVKLSDIGKDTLDAIKIATLGDSAECRLGEPVVVIGNALGYGQSVTSGIISALERSVTIDDNTYKLMQTSAAINPGNSGGALLNAQGALIGITSAKYADTSVEGMGFAIPISDAKPIIEAIIKQEQIPETERGYLGIYGKDVTEDVAAIYNMPRGIYVYDVIRPGAAYEAGIRQGDIITAINGAEVTGMAELESQLQNLKAGEEVTVTVKTLNNGQYEEKEFKVTLQKKVENTTQDNNR